MSKISFLSGINIVGGVSTIVGGEKEALIFDFGAPVEYHFEKSLKEYLLTKKAAPYLSLYRKEYLGDIDENLVEKLWESKELPKYEEISIFISHIHPDHMGLLKYLNSNVNVYMSYESKIIYEALIKANQESRSEANIIGLPYDDYVILGEEISIKLSKMDHGVIGSCGVLINVNGKKVAYTGDYKFHGRNPEWSIDTMNKWKEDGLDILITETTTIKQDSYSFKSNIITEEDVKNKLTELIKDNEGILYVNYLIRDILRVGELIRVAKEYGMKVAMNEVNATVWYESCVVDLAKYENDIVIYGDICNEKLPYKRMSVKEIANEPSKYIVYLDHNDVSKLIEFESYKNTEKQSNYLHADGWPLGNDENLLKWLKSYRILSHLYSTGGHAYPEDITNFIGEIGPKMVIPIHGNYSGSVDSGEILKRTVIKGETLIL